MLKIVGEANIFLTKTPFSFIQGMAGIVIRISFASDDFGRDTLHQNRKFNRKKHTGQQMEEAVYM